MLQNEPHHLLFLRLLSLLYIFNKVRDFARHIQSERTSVMSGIN